MSITPLDSLQVIVNGEVAQTVAATDRARITFDGPVAIPDGPGTAERWDMFAGESGRFERPGQRPLRKARLVRQRQFTHVDNSAHAGSFQACNEAIQH